jgi:hypothetical protein
MHCSRSHSGDHRDIRIHAPRKALKRDRDQFSISTFIQHRLASFSGGGFKLVRDTRRLPSSVLQAYTERGGSRLAMANPGTRFEATDYISDSSVPRKRLIFAAFTQDKCIVSYEQGGYALTFNIALFRLSSAHAEPVWKGFCSATDLENLRSEVAKGRCKTDGE